VELSNENNGETSMVGVEFPSHFVSPALVIF